MDFRSSLFGWGKPEELVLGAELKCPYGSKHSFLILPIGEMDSGSLPCGCVTDSKAKENIFPFGECKEGKPCEELMDLAEEWENLNSQDMLINGKEAITTDSILMCKRCGVGIEAVTSGQDGVIAKQWMQEAMLLYEIEQKYPGLVGVITDPNGSVYVGEEMYQDAINFLEDCVERNGGKIDLASLISPKNLESELIRIVLDLLIPGCDAARPEMYLDVMESRGTATGMCEALGWDAHVLNDTMIQMLRIDCEQTAEKVRTGSLSKIPEEHKKVMRRMGKVVLEVGYGLVLFFATASEDVRRRNSWGNGKSTGKNSVNIIKLSNSSIRHIKKHTFAGMAEQAKYLSDEQLANKLKGTSFFNKDWFMDEIINVYISEDGSFDSAYGVYKYVVEDFR